jgi:hypothetical protein
MVRSDESVESRSTRYDSHAEAGVFFSDPVRIGDRQLFVRYTLTNLEPTNILESSRMDVLYSIGSNQVGSFASLGGTTSYGPAPSDFLYVSVAGGLPVNSGITSSSGNGRHVLVGLLDEQFGQIAIWVDPDASDYYNHLTGENSADAGASWSTPTGGTPALVGYTLIRNVDDQIQVDDVLFTRTWGALGISP